jgi:hypothetical protein
MYDKTVFRLGRFGHVLIDLKHTEPYHFKLFHYVNLVFVSYKTLSTIAYKIDGTY